MTDWNTPGLADEYSDFRDFIKEQLDHVGREDFTSDTNIPTGFVRTNTSSYKKEVFTGSTWALTAREQEIDSHIGNTALHQGAPLGAIMAWPTNSAPSNFLLCQGQAVSRTTYADLFALIAGTYGTGDGSTTFNLPDLRGYMPIGRGGSGSANQALGTKFGAIDHVHAGPSHTHTVASHSHSMQSHTHTGGAHTHTVADHQHTVPGHYHDSQGSGADIAVSNAGGAHAHGIPIRNNVTGFANGGDAYGKVSPAWAGVYGPPTETSGGHVHGHGDFSGKVGNVTGGNSGDGTLNTGLGGAGTSGSGGAVASGAPSVADTGTASPATNSAGTGDTSANNPPCFVLNWIIKAV